MQYLNVLKHIYNKKDKNISYKKFIEKSMLNVNDLDFDNFTNIDFDRIYLIHLKNLLKELSETNRSERLKTINNINNNITQKTFVNFLRYQKKGADHPNFIYLIKHFKLELDNNKMIIFTEEFPFDNRIKKEALGIWYIFNIINTDELLSHLNYFEYNLQKYLEYSNLPVNENMTVDLCFSKLKIMIELDEPAHAQFETTCKDHIKDALIRSNSLYLYRLKFYNIFKTIPKNKNVNKKILNASYLQKSYYEIKHMFYGSLLLHKDFREDYIKKTFFDTFVAEIKQIDANIIIETQIKNDNYDEIIENKYKLRNKTQLILDNLN